MSEGLLIKQPLDPSVWGYPASRRCHPRPSSPSFSDHVQIEPNCEEIFTYWLGVKPRS